MLPPQPGGAPESHALRGSVQLCVSFDEHFLVLLWAVVSKGILFGSVLIIVFWLMSLNFGFYH